LTIAEARKGYVGGALAVHCDAVGWIWRPGGHGLDDLVLDFWVCLWGVVCDVSSFECVTETLVRIIGSFFDVEVPGGSSAWKADWPLERGPDLFGFVGMLRDLRTKMNLRV